MTYAPVIIPTLCRYKHFKLCIESLAKNLLAKNTEVYVAVDFPTKEEHWDGYKKIIEYLDNLPDYFKKLVVIKRSINLGPFENSYALYEYVFRNHDRIIFAEDDNEFAPNFLEYMNKGLDKYENDSSIMTISGYSRPVKWKFSNNTMYKNWTMSAWGYGIWKNRFLESRNNFNWEYFSKEIFGKHRFFELLKGSPWVFCYLMWCLYELNFPYGDMNSIAYMFLSKQYSIYPRVSKVKNHGFDGSGNLYKHDPKGFESITLDTAQSFDFLGDADAYIEENDAALKHFYRQPIKAILRGVFKGFYIWLRYKKRQFLNNKRKK